MSGQSSAETVKVMNEIQRRLEESEFPPTATLSFADYLPEASRLLSRRQPKWSPIDYTDDAVNAAAGALLLGASPKAYSHVSDFELKNGTVSLGIRTISRTLLTKLSRLQMK